MPVWLFDLLANKSPFLAGAIMAYFAYKAIAKLVDSPTTIATIFGVMGTKGQRGDAQRVLETLCNRGVQVDQSQLEPAQADDQEAPT